MAYLGSTPTTQSFISGTDYFNGTGSQTAFTLTRSVASVNDIQAVVNNVVQVPNDAYTLSGTTITFTSAPSAGTQNVYVRYLSTTTQAITPSQGTVSWSTLNSDVQQDLGISYKNRIINGNMVIDQRNAGASVTPANGDYTVDRWQYEASQASKFTVQQNQGSVTPPAGFINYLGLTVASSVSVGSSDYFLIEQSIEGYNIADLNFGSANAKTVTLSFWVRSSLTGTFSGAVGSSGFNRAYTFTYSISAANTWEYKTITIVGCPDGTWLTTNGLGMHVRFALGTGSTYSSSTINTWGSSVVWNQTGSVNLVGTNGATFYITGIQLEVGTQATTFTTAGGSYGAELALCQRYFTKLGGTTSGEGLGAGNIQDAANSGWFYVKYPVTMRTAPTAAFSSLRATNNADYNLTVNSIRGQTNGIDSSNIGFNFGSSGTTYAAVQLQTSATAGFLSFSAEL